MEQWYKNIDWVVLATWTLLVGIGLVAIFSATHGAGAEFMAASVRASFQRQGTWLALCAVMIGAAMFPSMTFFQRIAYPVYLVTLALCVITIFLGREVNGAIRWLHIGPIAIQASELMKVGTVLAVATYLANNQNEKDRENIKTAVKSFGLIALPVVVIMLQNDTGTALMFLPLIPVVLLVSGVPLWFLSIILAPVVAGYLSLVWLPGAIAFTVFMLVVIYFWTGGNAKAALLGGGLTGATVGVVTVALAHILRPHQVARIAAFLEPEEYRQTVGFHLIQSKAAIGGGGLTGQGYLQGAQTQMGYIPEQSTDFVFSVIGEEFGFIGGMVVIILYGVLLVRLLMLSTHFTFTFPRVVAAGGVSILFLHVMVNIGMVIGALPVMGVPLPFMSYGGSGLLAHTAFIAVILGLYHKRNNFVSIQ
jgi:rod shape determining protein RodA